MIDPATEAGRRAGERLVTEPIGWLTTVSPSGQPQSSPVWFLSTPGAGSQGAELVLRSLERTPRVRNIEANPLVSFHLDSDGEGGEIVTAEGEARIDPAGMTETEAGAYRAKYDAKVLAYGWTWEGFGRDYPVVIRIRVTRVRVG